MNLAAWAVPALVMLAVTMMVYVLMSRGPGWLLAWRENSVAAWVEQVQSVALTLNMRRLLQINLALMAVGALALWLLTGSVVVVVLLLIGGALLPRFLFNRLRRQRLSRFDEQMADALLIMAGALRAGVTVPAAIQQLVNESKAPLATEFEHMLREQRLGLTFEVALNNLARRVPTQNTILLVAVLRVAQETGGNLADTLDRAASTIRSKFLLESKIEALTALGKLQSIIVGLLPVGLLLVLHVLEPEAMQLLWTTPTGWATLVVLVVLECVGMIMVRRIVNVDV